MSLLWLEGPNSSFFSLFSFHSTTTPIFCLLKTDPVPTTSKGPWHLLFPLPETVFSQKVMGLVLSFTSVSNQLLSPQKGTIPGETCIFEEIDTTVECAEITNMSNL